LIQQWLIGNRSWGAIRRMLPARIGGNVIQRGYLGNFLEPRFWHSMCQGRLICGVEQPIKFELVVNVKGAKALVPTR
jgi:hypothetical protein